MNAQHRVDPATLLPHHAPFYYELLLALIENMTDEQLDAQLGVWEEKLQDNCFSEQAHNVMDLLHSEKYCRCLAAEGITAEPVDEAEAEYGRNV